MIIKLITSAILLISWTVANAEDYVDLPKVNCSGLDDDTAVINLDDIAEPRIISNRGHIHTFVMSGDGDAKAIEEKRESRIAQDFKTLANLINYKGPGLAQITCFQYTQNYKRSRLTIETVDALDAKKQQELLLGPTEHLFLSADMPVTNIKQLDYDFDKQEVIEKEKPSSFHVGFNYKLGDVYRKYNKNEIYKNIAIKLMIEGSSNPLSSVGVGLSYEFKNFGIFAAQIWSEDAASVSGTKPAYTDATVFGISYNLTKALDWLKSDD